MNNLTKLLNEINVPIWINKTNNIIFTNNEYMNLVEEKKKLYKQIQEITANKAIGYFENIVIDDKIYNKLVIPIDSEDTLLGLLIKKETNKDKGMFNLLIDSIPEIIFCKDNDLKYTIINKECEQFYKSRGVTEIIGKTDLDFNLDKDFLQTCTDHDKIVMKTKKPLYIEEKVPIENSDEFAVYQTIKTPIIDENGNLHGLLGSVRDISEQKKIEEKLRYLSYRDLPTGLYNRTYFEEKISELTSEKDFQIGVIIGDLNALKIVNDVFGHLEGDKLIKTIAEILTNVCGNRGYVFRWGGDEFITLLINSSEKDCESYIEDVNNLCKEFSKGKQNISISQGYSILNSNNSDIDNVLIEADKMLYNNKNFNKKNVSRITIERIMNVLDEKNLESKEHLNLVLHTAMEIGSSMKLDYKELEKLRLLAWLHDIGKSPLDEDVLLKKGTLSQDEYKVAKDHVKIGYKIATTLPEINHIAKEILYHHERWDGKGYPEGLKGEEIPLLSRIINVADAYSVMINGTIYKDKMDKKSAILELKRNSGTQFDPSIVNVLLEVI